MKSIVVNVPKELHHKFKMYALKEKKSMTEILTDCIKEILEKDSKSKK